MLHYNNSFAAGVTHTINECDECGFTRISYNSCRNRHCPKCQTLSQERWIDARKDDLLNVGYFHIVFTILDTLNSVAYQNQRAVYGILFKAAAETTVPPRFTCEKCGGEMRPKDSWLGDIDDIF